MGKKDSEYIVQEETMKILTLYKYYYFSSYHAEIGLLIVLCGLRVYSTSQQYFLL